MEIHYRFTEWAVSLGVDINGIAAHKFSGRGLGIVAQKRIKAGETILSVPISALKTIHTVPKPISRKIGRITTHGLLAAEMCLDTSPDFELWMSVLPTREGFQESMPLMWNPSLQSLLPDAAQKLLSNQQSKLKKDWAAVSKAFPEILYDDYLYRWLIVNTRTFYFLDPKTEKKPPRDDCLALNPFADYFNHASQGCEVSFGSDGYTVIADQAIKKGSEIYISYGNHSNDFLLTEYGFILEPNRWDEISLDSYILPLLSLDQKSNLKGSGFLGKYVLDRETVCNRTQVALRIICLPLRKWERFANGADDGEKDQGAVDQILLKVFERYSIDVELKIALVSKVDSGGFAQKQILIRRWEEIGLLLEKAIERIP